MLQNVVVIGAGVGGLSTAIGLARSGRNVTVVDKDAPPAAPDPETAFATWERPGVPQARQPHNFWARSRNLLLEHIPDVIDRLRSIGVGEWNILDMAPPELRAPEDAQFTSLLVRRVPFEFVLRGVAEEEPLIEFRQPEIVDRLTYDESTSNGVPVVTGVVLRSGEAIGADVVIDAAGRRSPVGDRLAERGVDLIKHIEDCGMVYLGRYYRQHEHSALDPGDLLRRNLGDLGYMVVGTFNGDNRSLAMFLGTPPWDDELKPLRHDAVWEAACRSVPAIADWVDPAHTEAITPVQPMAGHKNTLRRMLDDNGRPLALGVLLVGDALCTTNPAFGWGASLALTYAFEAVRAIRESDGDLGALARDYATSVMDEAETRYRVSAAMDRIRVCQWRGVEVASEDKVEADRLQLLAEGLNPAMRRDMHVLRAMMRRLTLIDHPDAIWSDDLAMATAREVAEWRRANGKSTPAGPTRDEMLELIAEHTSVRT